MKYLLLAGLLAVSLFGVQDVLGQDAAQDEYGDDILMLEEIIIQVAPELPTVVVTIERQQPQLKEVKIQSPVKRMVAFQTSAIKPDLTKMKSSKIKDSEKMLARERKR